MNVFDLAARITLDTSDYENGLDNAANKSSSFGSKIKSGLRTAAKVGAVAITAATTAVTAFAKASIDAGSRFDAAMSQVAAVSGATGKDFDSLRDKAIEMGSKTKFSATESAEAFNYMAMAGWKTEDMLNGIEGIMNLAAASGENLATTSDIVTDALTAFGMSADESGHFADILAVASSNANTNVGMMGETFKYVAPVAGSMGYSAEDAAMAIGLMANSGIKASQAGTSLRSIITRLSTDAGASSKSLGALGILTEKLGVQFYNADGSARDFGDVLMETRDAWKDLTQEEQINYANKIAGQEAISGWNAIMNASESDVKKLTDAIENADGAALKMANTMQDNLAGDITIFKSAVEGAQIAISDKLTPTLREFVQFGTDGVSRLTTAFRENGLSGAMSELGTILSDGLSMIMSMLPQMAEAGVGLLTALVQGIVDNLPIALDGAVQIVTTLATGLSTGIPQLLVKIPEIIMALLSSLQEQLPTIAQAGIEMLQNLADGFASNIPSLLEQILPMILSFTETLRANFGQIIDAGIDLILKLVDGFIEGLPTLIAYIPTIITNITGLINDNLPKIIAAGVTIIGKLVVGLIQAIPTIIANLPQIINAIVNTFTAFNWINLGKSIITGLGNGLKSMVSFVKNIGSQLIDAIKGGFSKLPSEMLNIGKNIVQGVWNGIKGMIGWFTSQVRNFFSSIVSSVKNALGIHSPSKVFAGIGEYMAEGLGAGWNKAYGDVERLIDSGMDFSGNITTSGSYSGYGKSYGTALSGAIFNINVNGANIQDDQSLAERIAFEIQQIAYGKEAVFGAA